MAWTVERDRRLANTLPWVMMW